MATTRRMLLGMALSVTVAQGLLTASHLPPLPGAATAAAITDDIPPLANDSMMQPTMLNIPFGNNLSMDIYKPDWTSDPVPALIYVHPGCWKTGTKNMLRAWADRFVNELGFAVVTFNYRHSDEAPWPAQGNDVLDAIRYVKTQGSKSGIDTDHVGCFGESSGAHLCFYMATAGATNWETRPDVAVGMFGQTCFLCKGYTDQFPMPYGGYNNHSVYSDELFGFNSGTLWYLKENEMDPGAKQAEQIELVQSSEPLYQLVNSSKGKTSPIFIGQGEADQEVSPPEATYFSDELAKYSVHHKLLWVPGGGHSYIKWQDSHIEQAIDFVKENIGLTWGTTAGKIKVD